MTFQRATLGTLLRHLVDILDGTVEQFYARSRLDYRPRYTPVVRALLDLGPSSIRAVSQRAGMTHSAVSQTVSQMKKRGLVRTRSSGDARERIVSLTSKAKAMIPALEGHWAATNAASDALDDELSTPLSDLLREVIDALERRKFTERIEQARAKLKQKKMEKLKDGNA